MTATVLQDKIIAGHQKPVPQDFIRDSLKPVQSIWRVRESNVKALTASGKEIEDIVVNDCHIPKAQAGSLAADKRRILPGHLHAPDILSPPGSELERDCTCAAEKIEHLEDEPSAAMG